MKNFFPVTLLFLTSCMISCNQAERNHNFSAILEGLKLNFTQDLEQMEGDEDFYFEFYALASQAEHDSLSRVYQKAVYQFYHADKRIIGHLLEYEKSTSINQWLYTGRTPLASSYNLEKEYPPESEAALILMDYFLSGRARPIKFKNKPRGLTYPAIRRFYQRYQHQSLTELRILYWLNFK